MKNDYIEKIKKHKLEAEYYLETCDAYNSKARYFANLYIELATEALKTIDTVVKQELKRRL